MDAPEHRYKPDQSQLAKNLNVSTSTVSDWKYGDTTPSLRHLAALHEETGIPFAELAELAGQQGARRLRERPQDREDTA